MKNLRKLIGLMTAMMLAAFAGSAMAAGGKIFYVEAPLVIAPTATSVSLKFCNSSPGPSTINSLQIVAPAGALFTIVTVSPGNATVTNGTTAVVNNISGIKKGTCASFTVTIKDVAAGCNFGNWGVAANAGNSFPQGDIFDPESPPKMKVSSNVGCDGLIACGAEKDVSVNGAGIGNSGYALLKVSSTLKDGSACAGELGYSVSNTLLSDNKLAVALSNQSAVFSVEIVSLPLANDQSTGWPSKRVQVATTQTNGAWNYVDGNPCTCAQLSASCMPTPYTPPALCVADYSWIATSAGFAKYSALITGVGNDPAMGWSD